MSQADIKSMVTDLGIVVPKFSCKDPNWDEQADLIRSACDKILDIVAGKINIVNGKPLGFHVRSSHSGYYCGISTEYYDFGRIVSTFGVDRDGGVDNSISIIFSSGEDEYIRNKKELNLSSFYGLGRECVAEKLRDGRYLE